MTCLYHAKQVLRAWLLIALFAIVGNTSLFASHIAGVEINYNCLGGTNYEITLSLYRDCSGIPAPLTPTINLSSSCGASQNLVLTNISVSEVSDLCPNQLANSTCNSGILPGIQSWQYTGTANLAGCNDWDLSFSSCCRNSSVNLAGQSGFYIHSNINLANGGCNNSPVFPQNRPIPYIGLNSSQNVLSFVAYDPDGDQLQYSLVSAMVSPALAATYAAGYSATQPMGANVASINPNTGMLTINNPLWLGNYFVAVKVEEFDNAGNSKGYIIREAQFVVVTATNQNPVVNGSIFNVSGGTQVGNTNIIQSNPGSTVCFDIQFSDPDTLDSLDVSTTLGQIYPGATVTLSGVNPITATVCASIPVLANTSHAFTVTASDNACPINSKTPAWVKISLPTVVVASPDVSLCLGDTAQLYATGDTVYTWTVISGDPIVVGTNFGCTSCASTWASPSVPTTYLVTGGTTGTSDTVTVTPTAGPNVVASNDTIACLSNGCVTVSATGAFSYLWSNGATTDTTQICTPGTYTVTGTDSNGCTGVDTVVVASYPAVSVSLGNDTTVCPGTCLPLITSPNNLPFYNWSTAAASQSIGICSPGSYWVVASDSNGCFASDTIVVSNYPTPPLSVSNDTSICSGDSVLLSASGSGTFLWSNGDIGSSTVVNAGGTYAVTLTDANGCTAVDSVTVSMHPNPSVYAGPDTVLCIGDTLTLTATGAQSYVWSNGATTASADYTIPGLVTVTGTDSNGCTATDSLYLFPNSSRYVAGHVTDSNGNALTNTWVYLIKYFNVQDSVVALDSVLTDSNGFYLFGTTETVVYVKSGPDSAAYPMQVPTYHGSAPVFVQADSILTVPCDTAWADIDNLSGMNPGGPAFVAGYVYQGAGKTVGCEGDPVVGLSLVLLNANGDLMAQTYTDTDGNYRFENVLPGTYTIWADDPSIDLSLAPTFTIATGDNGLDANLHYKNNTLELCGGVGIAPVFTGLESLHFFPNPSTGEVTLELSLTQAQTVNIQVLDALGATVWQQQVPGNNKQIRETFNLSALSTGIYFLQVRAGDQSMTRKLILR